MGETQRYAIPYKGLKPGCHEFRFEVDGSLFEEYQSTEIKDGRCEVTVGADRSESRIVLDVAITGYVIVECDRCLEDCRIPIDFEGQLVVKFSEEVHEYDGEVMFRTYPPIFLSTKCKRRARTDRQRPAKAPKAVPRLRQRQKNTFLWGLHVMFDARKFAK